MKLGKGIAVVFAFEFAQAATTINSLARDVSRVESVREVKDLQRAFAQLAQFGRWKEMAALFDDDGTLKWGNQSATGTSKIENWLRIDAGKMDGIRPGSLDTLVAEQPLISLSIDGLSAKGRWNGLRFMGDGEGGTRIQGGIYESEFVLSGDRWKFSLQHYYPLYSGPYLEGWRNVGGALAIIPYHFTPDSAGVPIPVPEGEAPITTATAEDLEHRISKLNDEDEVRNLQNSYGYYVDRRMWTDIVDLFVPNATVTVRGVGTFSGLAGVRQALENGMGPEGLTQGILNDHPLFDTIVEINPNGKDAIARGIEIGMVGNANTREGSWEFTVFRNAFVKDNGLWKMKGLDVTQVMFANYSAGWGNGGTIPPNNFVPAFLEVAGRSFQSPTNLTNILFRNATDLSELQRRLSRSAAFDGAENESAAYGFFVDDLRCDSWPALFAKNGHKAFSFAGFYHTRERVTQACQESYGSNHSLSDMRSGISFHWRPQSVVLVSEDGRSASLRARLIQPSTSMTKAGSFNGAIYEDQVVLENGKWKLWSVTIDEFYFQSSDWAGGWSAANPRALNATNPEPLSWTKRYLPDLTLVDVGDREAGFMGASGRYIAWPEIQRMWFGYRNLVSGRAPEHYWPHCVPCQAKPEWSLAANGYQEPPTGPGNSTDGPLKSTARQEFLFKKPKYRRGPVNGREIQKFMNLH